MVLPFLPSTLPIILMIRITPQLRCFYFFLYVYYYFLLLYFFYFYNFLPSLLCSHLSHFRGLLLLQQSIFEADDVTLPAPRRPLLSSYPITDGQTLQQKLV